MGYDDNVQLAKKVLNSDKRTIEMIETYWARKFYSGYQDTTYSRRLAEATLALVSRYTIEDISITHNEFNSSMQCIVSRLYIQIVDVNNKIGHISASCFNTPKGYQIIPKSVNITYDWGFDEVIAEAYVNSLNNSFR